MLGQTGIVVTFAIQHSNFYERGQIKKIYLFIYLFFSYLQNFAVDPNAIFNVRINKLRNKNFFSTTTGFEPLTLDTTIERTNFFFKIRLFFNRIIHWLSLTCINKTNDTKESISVHIGPSHGLCMNYMDWSYG